MERVNYEEITAISKVSRPVKILCIFWLSSNFFSDHSTLQSICQSASSILRNFTVKGLRLFVSNIWMFQIYYDHHYSAVTHCSMAFDTNSNIQYLDFF